MMEMKLRSVPYGTTFQAFGDEFVALDYADGGVLAIRKNNWKYAAFDEGGVNDLRTASINKHLADYEDALINAGAQGWLRARNIDLKAVDGTREYGYVAGVCVGLLTLEQYGKYQHIIPDADDWWWLATPWRTPGEKSGGATYALGVLTDGGWSSGSCSYAGCAIRPALVFSSDLLVSIGNEEDGNTDGEETAYRAYMEYVKSWTDSDHETGDSPMSFEDWKEAEM